MPVAAPPPPPVHATIAAHSRAEVAIVREINRVRRSHHLRAVRINVPLGRVARTHSKEMLQHDVLSHSSFDGSSFSTRLARAGKHRRYAETLAWAPRGAGVNAKVLVRLWMGSTRHRAVLMNGTLRRVGVGRVYGAMGSQAGNAITADFSS
jgi:uncharacterized protein YkwD